MHLRGRPFMMGTFNLGAIMTPSEKLLSIWFAVLRSAGKTHEADVVYRQAALGANRTWRVQLMVAFARARLESRNTSMR